MWTYLLADIDGTIRTEVPFSSFRYTPEMNGVGGWSGVVPLSHPNVTPTNFDPGRTAVWAIDHGGTVRWGGLLWAHERGVGNDSNELHVGGSGWLGALERRIPTLGYTATGNPVTIVANVLFIVELGGVTGLSYSWHTGSGLYTPNIQTYDYPTAYEILEEWANLDTDGFDFEVFFSGTQESGFTPTLTTSASQGRDTDLMFDTNTNMIVTSMVCNAEDMANQVWATGSGSGASKNVGMYSQAVGSYPRWQRTINFGNNSDTSQLTALATREVNATGNDCQKMISAEIYDRGDQPVLGTFINGDTVNCIVSDDFDHIDERFRIYAHNVEIDENGKETISVEMVQDAIAQFGRFTPPNAWRDIVDLKGRVNRLEKTK